MEIKKFKKSLKKLKKNIDKRGKKYYNKLAT